MSIATRDRSGLVLLVVGALVVSILSAPWPAAGAPAPIDDPYRAFGGSSWWNTPLPPQAPEHPNEGGILNYLRTAEDNGGGFLRFAGADDSEWGQPVYWASSGDREYDVRWSAGLRQPELDNLRIPANMRAADTSDGALTLFDVERGYVVAMTDAAYNAPLDSWSVGGATVTYLDSNGLDSRLLDSDDRRNSGSHRGNNGATMMARLDEVRAGAIEHVIKVTAGRRLTSGMSSRWSIPTVTRRLRRSRKACASGSARTSIWMPLGCTPRHWSSPGPLRSTASTSGTPAATALKLENTRAEGRGQLWDMSADALSDLPFTTQFWDVILEGYDPPGVLRDWPEPGR
ncbi:MAG: hypothetical protein H0V67_07180 [Geodermatophilaceae bacterium]|nr:hypothetical protein [Geodermatophilaceae bacterium]